MRPLLRPLAVLAVLSAAVVAWPGHVGATSPDQYGWWNKAQQVPATPLAVSVPAPPTAPADGLYLALDPTGPAALAALRFLSPVPGDATLTLKVTSGQSAAGASVLACPLAEGATWEPTQNGAWASRPAFNCDLAQVAGTVAADGASITWVVPASFQAVGADTVDVALVPSGSTPFQFGVDKPDDSSFSQSAPPPVDTDTGGETTDVPPLDFTATSFLPDAGGSFVPSLGAPDTTFTAPPATRANQVATGPIGAVRNPLRKDASRGERIAAVLALLAIGGVWMWLTGQPLRAPRLLGSLGARAQPVAVSAGARVGGVGRFARPRTAAPGKLL